MSDEFLSGIWLKAFFIVGMGITWIGLLITLLFKYFWRID